MIHWSSVPSSLLAFCWFVSTTPAFAAGTHDDNRSLYQAPFAAVAPIIDGIGDEPAWDSAPWRAVEHRWLGPAYTAEDFQGRYKVIWTKSKLYVLFDLIDDRLIDRYADPLVQYWDDDTLEVFIDEDHSGGDHQYNHNAFAYHFALDNQAIDIGTDRLARAYNNHIESHWRRNTTSVSWEVSIDIYDDSFQDNAQNTPVTLQSGKIMGFMLAYCDNDGSELRENFIGSEYAAGPSKDRGWIDAGLFGTLQLIME